MKIARILPFLVFFVLLSNVKAAAQTTSGWAWARGDSLSSSPIDMETDAVGNVYVLSPYLTKYNSKGTLIWQVKLPYPQMFHPKGLALDAAGNIYIAGNFPLTITLDTISLTSVGKRDIFVAKFNPAGRIQWARRAGGTGNILPDPGYIDDTAWDIVVDAVGNSYITGGYHTANVTVQFDSITIPPFTGRAFMAKYNPNGKIRWVTPLPNPETEKISITSRGIVILRGFELTCYNTSNGSVVWTQTKTGTGYAARWGYFNDDAGNSYLTGNFDGTVTFGPFSLTATSGGSATDKDIFLVKYDRNGNVKWARKSTGMSRSNGEAVTADSQGNVYITGGFRGTINFSPTIQITNPGTLTDIFVAKYDSAGTALWAEAVESGGDGSGFAIDALANGDVYVAGTYRNSAIFGPHALASSNNYSEFFLAKYSANLLGTPKVRAASNFQLYPNPAHTAITIRSNQSKNAMLEIYSLTGQQVFKASFQTETKLSVKDFPAGLYLVKISSEGKTQTQKLIVTH